MFTVAMVMVLLFAVYIFWNDGLRIIRAKRCGTETDARVCRIEDVVRHTGGADYPYRYYYAVFKTDSGLMNEARLLNPKKQLVTGTRIKVRYLPEKADCAVLTEII